MFCPYQTRADTAALKGRLHCGRTREDGASVPTASGLPWVRAKEGNCQGLREAEGGQAWGGQALVAGLHMHRIMFFFLRKGNGVCSKSFSATCLLWKPQEVRVRCPAQKHTCHTPSIQPNTFILQVHNPSFVWTAVSKQPWTQRTSQTSPSAEPGEGNVGLPGKLGAQTGAVLRNFQKH